MTSLCWVKHLPDIPERTKSFFLSTLDFSVHFGTGEHQEGSRSMSNDVFLGKVLRDEARQ